MKWILIFLVGGIVGLAPTASPVPQLINYQGMLTDSDTGEPLTGPVDIVFHLYESATILTPLWSESWPDVNVTNGLFHVLLGGITPLADSLFVYDLWLGTTVGMDDELVPRVRLASVPYAYRAAWADSITQQNALDVLALINALPDADQDGYIKISLGGDDCNDSDPLVHPGAPEACDWRDHDCDGIAGEGENNPGCRLYYADVDGDTWGNSNDARCLCYPVPPYTVLSDTGDCDDDDQTVHPFGWEICDGSDDDCDGVVDDSITVEEVCNGWDDDCDGEIDEGENLENCEFRYRDMDQDGYGEGWEPGHCVCENQFPYTASQAGDCDDSNPALHPGAQEVCNNMDDNCDGEIDWGDDLPGCSTYYRDMDGDGWGNENQPRCICHPDGQWTTTLPGDCADWDPNSYPGAPAEVCDEFDNDCDGEIDEGLDNEGCVNKFLDMDGDGWGTDDFRCLCQPDPVQHYTANVPGDCDDTNPDIHPGAPEVCNNIDDDCDGEMDEGENNPGCVMYYRDMDGDGWGDEFESRCLCQPEFPYLVTQAGDCSDNDPEIHPGAPEVCDWIDDDCDGNTDEGSCPPGMHCEFGACVFD